MLPSFIGQNDFVFPTVCDSPSHVVYVTSETGIILPVERDLVKRLLALNREFYSKFSEEFSDSRSSERLNLEPLRPYLANGQKLLDVGCGNGRLAGALDAAGYALDYVGVDGSVELVAAARERCDALKQVPAQYFVADLAEDGWHERVSRFAPFDVITALAVLHHLPGFDLRVQVLETCRALLAAQGALVLNNWQFWNSERLRHKIVPWSTLGIEAEKLEAGDYLLDWRRGGVGYRYVHALTHEEVQALARAAGLRVVAQFTADGDLNLYSVLRR